MEKLLRRELGRKGFEKVRKASIEVSQFVSVKNTGYLIVHHGVTPQMGSSTQRVPCANAVDTDVQEHRCAQNPLATDAPIHSGSNEPCAGSDDCLQPIKLEERTATGLVKREDQWHNASFTDSAFAGHIFLSLADFSSKYASRPSTASVATSTASSSADLCCGSCHAEWTDVEASSVACAGRWFCLCCKRRLPVSSFSSEECKKRLFRRCKPCISKEPRLEKALMAELPASIRRADAAEAALAQIWTEVQQYERNSSPHVLLSSLFSDPELLALERRERQQRDEQAQHPPRLFGDWLECETKRVSLTIEKTQLCSAMLQSRGIRLSSTASELMKTARIASEAFGGDEEDDDIDDSAPVCATCSAPLESPPAADEDVIRRLCHCCERVLPDSVMVRIPLTDDDLICSSCRLCGSPDDANILHSALSSSSARIQKLEDASEELLARFILIDGEDLVFQNHTLKAMTTAVSSFQRRRQALNKNQRRALQSGSLTVATSRGMYAEAMDLKSQLLTALEGQLKLLLEMAATILLTASESVADLGKTLFHHVEVDSELRQLIDKRWPHVQGFASVPCLSCSAKLRSPGPSLSDAACCDCCQRVLPEATLAISPLPDGTRVCRQCREQYPDSRKRLPRPRRPTRERIEALEEAATGLAEICNAFSATGRIPGDTLNHVMVAKQCARDCDRRRETVYRLQREQLAEGKSGARVSHVMYNDRMDMDSRYVDALTGLIRVLVENCDEHQLEVPEAWRDTAVRAANAPRRPQHQRLMGEEECRERARTPVGMSSPDVPRSTPYPPRRGFARVRESAIRRTKTKTRSKHRPGILGDFPAQPASEGRPGSRR